MRIFYILAFIGIVVTAVVLQQRHLISEIQTNSLVAATLPLLGVFLTLDWSKRQFERGLREEREKLEEARRFNAKREAFSDAAQAIIAYIGYLQTLPDRRLPSDGVSPEEFTRVGPALIKLHFYAELETIQVSTQLNRLLETLVGGPEQPQRVGHDQECGTGVSPPSHLSLNT